MRELRRSIARARMAEAGLTGVNRKRADGRSYFSRYWRKWLDKKERK